MKEGEEQLPDGYKLDKEAKVEKKRKSSSIIMYVVIIGIVLMIVAVMSGLISFGETTPTSDDNAVPTTETQQ